MSFLMTLVVLAVVAFVVLVVISSIKTIGPTEVGLVTKRFGLGKLGEQNAIAFRGEAG
jgi:regulator of protease activity HflC (stomatin/prohibitin superfamily)